jgi:hypothetical protein
MLVVFKKTLSDDERHWNISVNSQYRSPTATIPCWWKI